MRGLNLKQHNV